MEFRVKALSEPLDKRSRYLRKLIIQSAGFANRGHIGPALSIIDILRVLYDSVMFHDPKNPNLELRDIFILSKGHGALGLYSILADKGYFDISELESFSRFDSRLGGHPEWHSLPGIEFSTGSLGHGVAVAVGIAMSMHINQQDGRRVYVLIGDGELGEGAIWESLLHASKHNLSNLCLIIDYNNMQANGTLEQVLDLGDVSDKLRAFGFSAIEINGHSINELNSTLDFKVAQEKPLAIVAHTIKGKGVKIAENSPDWHHKANITREEISLLLENLY